MIEALGHPKLNSDRQQMIGLILQRVEYTEVDYYPAHPQPCYTTDHPKIHTVDFSVRLHFTNSQTFEIVWKNFEILEEEEYHAYGLDIFSGTKLKKSAAGQRTWNVSEEPIWQELIGQPVGDIKTYWSKTRVQTPKEEKELNSFHLQAIALAFANQKTIFISIAELQAGDLHKVVRGANNLLVTTDESLARQTNMLSEEATVV